MRSAAYIRARDRRRERRRSIVQWFKLTAGCQAQDCVGYPDNADALQIDHVERVLHARPPITAGRGWEQFWDYLLGDGQQVLCANCHAIKSARENREAVKEVEHAAA